MPTNLAFFALVKSSRSILSILLLSAYALLLLHDFIPHSHNSNEGSVQNVSEVHHKYEQHHHSHDHSEGKEEDKNTPEPSDNSLVVASLIHVHSHSDFAGHQHKLVYRVASKDKLLPQADVVVYRSENKWTLPDRLFDGNVKLKGFIRLLSNQFQTSFHGLRAPPALG